MLFSHLKAADLLGPESVLEHRVHTELALYRAITEASGNE